MAIVLDASSTVALALEEDTFAGAADIGERIAQEGAIVPTLWRFEVANSLLVAVRRGRIAASRPAVILNRLESLAIDVDAEGTARAWTATLTLAERHRLTVYDAAYLELALRLDAALASVDGDLVRASRQEGIEVIGG